MYAKVIERLNIRLLNELFLSFILFVYINIPPPLLNAYFEDVFTSFVRYFHFCVCPHKHESTPHSMMLQWKFTSSFTLVPNGQSLRCRVYNMNKYNSSSHYQRWSMKIEMSLFVHRQSVFYLDLMNYYYTTLYV